MTRREFLTGALQHRSGSRPPAPAGPWAGPMDEPDARGGSPDLPEDDATPHRRWESATSERGPERPACTRDPEDIARDMDDLSGIVEP